MIDLEVAIEALLLLGVSFAPLAAGIILRRKFRPADAAGSAAAAPVTGAQKMGRLAGNILFWGGILGILFMIVLFLHFKGKI
ncbi:MAG: hypothetical protein Q7R35_18455 [Elusimicrobiota bacterium]|nr:hypothetical protein [Elusimicrobiota bacterium]